VKPFKHLFIGSLSLANERTFAIWQIKPSGACRITDDQGKQTYSGSIANAWKSVCFQGDMDWRTNNTSKWRG